MDELRVHDLLRRLGCVNASTRSNGWVEASCPFAPYLHRRGADAQPSFGVSVVSGDASYYRCHACNERGAVAGLARKLQKFRNADDIAAFVREHNNTSYAALSKRLADKARRASEPLMVEVGSLLISRELLPRKDGYSVAPPLDEGILSQWEAIPLEVFGYLVHERGLSPSTIHQWELGWDAEKSRVSIPIRDLDGRFMGYSGRLYGEHKPVPIGDGKFYKKPKYLHSKGFQRDLYLYGEHLAPKGGVVFIVEGFFDVIALQAWGYAAVAVCGTYLSRVHAEKIRRLWDRAVLLFDGDPAGNKGATVAKELLAEVLPVSTVSLPDGLDPDQLLDPRDRLKFLGEARKEAA